MIKAYITLNIIILKSKNLSISQIVRARDFEIEVDYITNPTSFFILQEVSELIEKGDIIIVKDELGNYIYYGVVEIYETEEQKLYTTYIYNLFLENYMQSTNESGNTRLVFKYSNKIFNLIQSVFITQPSNYKVTGYPFLYSKDSTRTLNNINITSNNSSLEKEGLINIKIGDKEEIINIVSDIIDAFIKADVTVTPKYENGILTIEINNINIVENEPIIIVDKTGDIININSENATIEIQDNSIMQVEESDIINNTPTIYQYFVNSQNIITSNVNDSNRLYPVRTKIIKLDINTTASERVALARTEIGGADKKELITLNLKIANRTYNNDFIRTTLGYKIIDFDYFKIGRYAQLYIKDKRIDTILKGYRIIKNFPYIELKFGKR